MKTCPVPNSQRPIEEFKQLRESWFFSWAIKSRSNIYKNLIVSWIIIFPIIFTISTGSFSLKGYPLKMLEISSIFSLIVPLILTIRLLVGWNYILKRLVSEQVEYEESGWYDGQTWEKPLEWREKDLLIANYEVKPIIKQLFTILRTIVFVIVTSSVMYKLYQVKL